MAALPASLEGDQSRANELVTVTWVWCSLSLIVVSLRLYSRVWITRNLWWDDWVIFFTMVRKHIVQKNGKHMMFILDPHDNLFGIFYALCGQGRRSPRYVFELYAA